MWNNYQRRNKQLMYNAQKAQVFYQRCCYSMAGNIAEKQQTMSIEKRVDTSLLYEPSLRDHQIGVWVKRVQKVLKLIDAGQNFPLFITGIGIFRF